MNFSFRPRVLSGNQSAPAMLQTVPFGKQGDTVNPEVHVSFFLVTNGEISPMTKGVLQPQKAAVKAGGASSVTPKL